MVLAAVLAAAPATLPVALARRPHAHWAPQLIAASTILLDTLPLSPATIVIAAAVHLTRSQSPASDRLDSDLLDSDLLDSVLLLAGDLHPLTSLLLPSLTAAAFIASDTTVMLLAAAIALLLILPAAAYTAAYHRLVGAVSRDVLGDGLVVERGGGVFGWWVPPWMGVDGGGVVWAERHAVMRACCVRWGPTASSSSRSPASSRSPSSSRGSPQRLRGRPHHRAGHRRGHQRGCSRAREGGDLHRYCWPMTLLFHPAP